MKTCVALLALANAVVCHPLFTLQGPGHDPDPAKTPPLKLPEGAVPLDHHGTYIDELDGVKVKVHYGVDEDGVHAEFVEPLGGDPVGTYSDNELEDDPGSAEKTAVVESLEMLLKEGQAGVLVDDAGGSLLAENGVIVPDNPVKCPFSNLENSASIKVVGCNEIDKYLEHNK